MPLNQHFFIKPQVSIRMAIRVAVPEWFNDSIVQEWIGRFQHQKGYRRNFIKWCKWIEMTPAEQLEKRREDLKSDDLKTQRLTIDEGAIFDGNCLMRNKKEAPPPEPKTKEKEDKEKK